MTCGRVVCLSITMIVLLVALGAQPGAQPTVPYKLPPPIASRLMMAADARGDRPRSATPLGISLASPLEPATLRAVIDTAWGPGLPAEEKLAIFDGFWNTIDRQFAAFHGIHIDWAALRNRYRGEIAAGVSRGRFAAIMNQLSLALRESHTQANDVAVLFTPPARDVPLFVIGGWIGDFSGACATPLPDGSALVYSVMPNHPLGLQPGDRVLGYDGRPWRSIYRDLIALELPMSALWWGSSPAAFDHSLMMSVTLNSHLFNAMDVVKHGSAVVQHLPTAPFESVASPFCAEQMDIPGVPKPNIFADQWVSFGVVEGTRIGYVYGYGWQGNAGAQFYEALRTLTQDIDTDGLIVDFRLNLGGNMFLSNDGLSLLFEQPQPTIGFASRADPIDHFKMRMIAPPGSYLIPSAQASNVASDYDKPIAVLTGPGAVSSGDQVALRMTYLPNARTFGKTTAAAFNAPATLNLSPEWFIRFAVADAYRVESPKNYLTHDEFVVHEPVWLEPHDVANGDDTVVRAAIKWIQSVGATR